MKTTTAALAALTAALAIAAAPTAAATPGQDATFLSLITNNGLAFKSADIAIAEGKAVCGTLDDGHSLVSTVQAVQTVMALDNDGAVTVVAAAVVAYCPWHMPAGSGSPTHTPVV